MTLRGLRFAGLRCRCKAWVAQLVEHILGKDEVAGSIPVPGSSIPGGVGRLRKQLADGASSQISESTSFLLKRNNRIQKPTT